MNRMVIVLIVSGGTLVDSTLWAADPREARPWEAHRFAAEPWKASPRLHPKSQLASATTGLPSVTTIVVEPISLVEAELGSQGSGLIASSVSYTADHAVGGLLPTTTIDPELATLNNSLVDPLAPLRQIRGPGAALEPSRQIDHLLRMQSEWRLARFEALPALGRPTILGAGTGSAWIGVYRP